MKLRLFVAFPLSQSLTKKLDHINQKNTSGKTSLAKKENFHITVFFLGYVEDKFLEEIKKVCRKIALKTSPFELFLDRIDLAPPKGTKRMIWAYFEKSQPFINLVNTTYSALKKFTEEEINWEPLPHVTLARSKQTLKAEDLIVNREILGRKVLKVEYLRVYRSQPSKLGSKYSVLAKFSLGNLD